MSEHNGKEKKDHGHTEAPAGAQTDTGARNYDALWDKYVRLQADFDNYQKRTQRERVDFVKYANESLILELLEIVDNFERGVRAADQKKDFGLLHQGVDMILKQLQTMLSSRGLTKIESVGKPFDPHQYEAVEVVDDPGAKEAHVDEELQAGYLLNGRIIRPARVRVKKPKGAGGEPKDSTPDTKEQDTKGTI